MDEQSVTRYVDESGSHDTSPELQKQDMMSSTAEGSDDSDVSLGPRPSSRRHRKTGNVKEAKTPQPSNEQGLSTVANDPSVDVRWHQQNNGAGSNIPIDLQNTQGIRPELMLLHSIDNFDASTHQDILGMLSHTPDALLDESTIRPLFATSYGHSGVSSPSSNAVSSESTQSAAAKLSGRYVEVPFTTVMPGVFLRNMQVHLRLQELEPIPATLHLFNQYKVTILLKHGGFEWEVRTRLKNIASLHNKLMLFRVKLHVPAASQSTRHKRQSMRAQLQQNGSGVSGISRPTIRRGAIKSSRKRSDSDDGDLSSEDDDIRPHRSDSQESARSYTPHRAIKYPRKSLARMDNRTQEDLEGYLRNLLLHPLFRSHKDVLALFEISALSFVPGLGKKLKEGLVKKRAGGYATTGGICSIYCCKACDICSGQYKERWLVLKETYLFFLSPKTGSVRGVLLMDQDFQVSNGFRHTGINNGLIVTSLCRRLTMMCDSDLCEKEWSAEIRRVQHQYASDFVSGSNRHKSFAPERHGSLANWYVDGSRYMWDVADVIDKAVEEVFITDWWLSPDIYMKRPDLTATQWKLSEVLKRAASRGVKVYVLVYKEVEMALGLNSLYTKKLLNSLHPNILVLRHPDHGGGGTLYWAHHEKIVVVDQQHAFVSGIDLCYGRWDDYRHRLVDLGHAGLQKKEPPAAAPHKKTSGGASFGISGGDRKKSKEKSGSQSSIAQLVMGTNLLVNTLQTPMMSQSASADDSTSGSPELRRQRGAFSESSLTRRFSKKPAKPALSLQIQPSSFQNVDVTDRGQKSPTPPTSGSLPSVNCVGVPPPAPELEVTASGEVVLTGVRLEHENKRQSTLSRHDTSESCGSDICNRTLTTDLDTSIPAPGNDQSSMHNIPDIVEEVLKRRRPQSDGQFRASSSDRISTDELKRLTLDHRQPHLIITPAQSNSDDEEEDTVRLRSVSEPVKEDHRKNSLFRKSLSESYHPKGRMSHIRRKSMELMERTESFARRRGAKSDSEQQNRQKRLTLRGKLFRNDNSPDSKASGTDASDDDPRSGFGTMKNRGRELMGEVRSKGADMKNWTRRKIPTLTRMNSMSSEADGHSQSKASKSKRNVNRWRNIGKVARKERQRQTEQFYEMEKKKYQYQGPILYDSTSIHLWVGKDYVNWITKDLNNPDEPFSDSVDRHKTPRMPWHDIGLYVEGAAARDVARHFIQRWNAIKVEKVKANEKYPFLLPRTYHPDAFSPSVLPFKQKVRCQVLRSVGEWSSGQHEAERSIYNAYHYAIRNAKHYIYIENQFFISCSSDTSVRKEVHNRIAGEIVERIVRAHRSNTLFRVYVLLPLLPAFEGQIGTPSGTAMQFILHYTLATIVRGERSLIKSLEKRGVANWRKYICFNSLRSYDTLDGCLVSELVYIHSKLLIVDDKLVIAGSANINDRSMLGERDSEVALIIEDEEFEDGLMDGKPYRRGLFAGSMRRYLFSEHLGLIEPGEVDNDSVFSSTGTDVKQTNNAVDHVKPIVSNKATLAAAAAAFLSGKGKGRLSIKDIVDPVCDHFYNDVWRASAANNTKIYDEVFQCYPTDRAKTFEDVVRLRSAPRLALLNPSLANTKLQQIQGNVVEFPLEFLSKEFLKPGLSTKEGLLPTEMWT